MHKPIWMLEKTHNDILTQSIYIYIYIYIKVKQRENPLGFKLDSNCYVILRHVSYLNFFNFCSK